MTKQTKLYVSDADKELAWLDVSDEALGRFARWFIIMANKDNIERAEAKDMPMLSLMAMHGGIALCRMAHEANADTFTTEFTNAKSASGNMGDWKITVKRVKAKSEPPAEQSSLNREGGK